MAYIQNCFSSELTCEARSGKDDNHAIVIACPAARIAAANRANITRTSRQDIVFFMATLSELVAAQFDNYLLCHMQTTDIG